METKYKGHNWQTHTKIIGEIWENYDLTESVFSKVFFKNMTFKNCIFVKSKFDQMGLFGCNFIDCLFEEVGFKNVAIGANGGEYVNCRFLKCDFRGKEFNYPHFAQCLFSNCKLTNINFNDSTFYQTKFIGKLDDVNFNGMYHKVKTNYKPLEKVDFSEAIFKEFVTFYNCDLSTCTPPKDKTFDELLYQIYSNDPSILSTGSEDRIVLTKK